MIQTRQFFFDPLTFVFDPLLSDGNVWKRSFSQPPFS